MSFTKRKNEIAQQKHSLLREISELEVEISNLNKLDTFLESESACALLNVTEDTTLSRYVNFKFKNFSK